LACCRKGIGFPTSRDQENIEEPGAGVQKDHFDMLNAGCISRIFLHVSHFVVNDGYLVNIQDMEQMRLKRLLSIEIILEFDLLAQSVHGRMGTYQHSQRIVLVAFVSFCHVS
jgi:hypothetical protein